jgi:hypothetical protein
MNKDKLLEVKKMVMYEIGLAVEKSANKQIDFGKQMAIVGVLGDLTANIDANFDDIIQTEPDETKGVDIDAFKNNFDVITKSPERLVHEGMNLAALKPYEIAEICFKLMEYQDLEEKLQGIPLHQLVESFIAATEKEMNEKYGKARILTNQDLEDYNDRFWRNEALKYADQLGMLRIWFKGFGTDMDTILAECETMFPSTTDAP